MAPGVQEPCEAHDPLFHAQSFAQVSVWVPQLPQPTLRVAPGWQPCPRQGPASHWQALLQRSISAPQLPQLSKRVALGAQAPWFAQAPACHWQLLPQVSVSLPQLPHAEERWLPGAQGPSPPHPPKPPQTPLLSQTRECVPQLPHGCVSESPGRQPEQPPLMHLVPQARHAIPPRPHAGSVFPARQNAPAQQPGHDWGVQAQMPATHCWPFAQALPQAPQWRALDAGSTQLPPHSSSGAGHPASWSVVRSSPPLSAASLASAVAPSPIAPSPALADRSTSGERSAGNSRSSEAWSAPRRSRCPPSVRVAPASQPGQLEGAGVAQPAMAAESARRLAVKVRNGPRSATLTRRGRDRKLDPSVKSPPWRNATVKRCSIERFVVLWRCLACG